MKPGAVFKSVIAVLALLAWPAHSAELPAPARQCLVAGQTAARQAGVPPELMSAISLVESGRARDGKIVPWPWTINADGKGYWFPSKAEAIAFVEKLQDQGSRSIDVGCFQINLRWHPEAFSSLQEAFNPLSNARYAAQFIKSLKQPDREWIAVAGAYHSGNEQFAALYRKRVNTALGLGEQLVEVAAVSPQRARRAGGIVLAWHATARGTGLLTAARGPIFALRAGSAQP